MYNEEMHDKAVTWLDKMQPVWADAIADSTARSIVERNYMFQIPQYTHTAEMTKVLVVKMSTEEAIRQYAEQGHTCVLNFADYISPGGGFMRGSRAQEESLCHVSSLYPVLCNFKEEYERRCEDINDHLYYEDFIYSPDILFTRKPGELDNPIKVDVLSYAAPNRRKREKTEEYYEVFRKRICTAFAYPYTQGCDTVILGAWGCGAFKNDASYVAEMWNAATLTMLSMYKTIIHPIPLGKNRRNYMEFFNRITVGRVY